MTSKLGPHIIEPYRIKQYDAKIAAAKPRVVKVVGSPSELGFLAYLEMLLGSQNTLYVARIFPYEQAVTDAYNAGKSPFDAADIMIAALSGFVNAAGLGYAYFECGMNEPPDASIPWLNQYYSYIVPLLKSYGVRCVSFNFSVCHPPLSAWSQLGDALTAIKQAGREWALVGLHQYGLFGNMQDYADSGEGARVLRHRCIPELADQDVVITETGLDSPGWKQTGINAEDYFTDFQWLDYELRKDDNVIGATAYTMDSAPGWEPHRLDGSIADHIFDYWQVQNANSEPIFPDEPEPPEPPVEPPALVGITVKSPGCNMRREPTVNSDWLGFAAPGSEFNVEYPPTNEYNYIPDLDCWIWGNNIYIA